MSLQALWFLKAAKERTRRWARQVRESRGANRECGNRVGQGGDGQVQQVPTSPLAGHLDIPWGGSKIAAGLLLRGRCRG